ncbi:MAG: ribonuclease HII [Nitrospirota bacterium]
MSKKQLSIFPGGRTEDIFLYEEEIYRGGYNRIAGVDEAGRGPLAGPVVAAAVTLSREIFLKGLDDSKRLSEKKREDLFLEITTTALSVGIGIIDVKEIDETDILRATIKAAEIAIISLNTEPDFLLTDALHIPVNIPQKSLIKGDSRSASIAAASIIAKVTRDRLMMEYHRIYPEYKFHIHKGYATKEHLKLLKKHGPCEIHRKSFKGVIIR